MIILWHICLPHAQMQVTGDSSVGPRRGERLGSTHGGHCYLGRASTQDQDAQFPLSGSPALRAEVSLLLFPHVWQRAESVQSFIKLIAK